MARAFARVAAANDGESGKICRAGARAAVLGCRPLPLKPLNLHEFPYVPGWPAGCKQVTAPEIAEVPQCRVQRRTSVPRPQSRLRHGRRRRRRPKTTPRTMAAAPLRPCSMPPQPPRTPRLASSATGRPTHVHGAADQPRRNSPPAATLKARPRPRRRGAQTSADATKNAECGTATPVASSNATVNPSPAQNAIANQAGAAAPTDIAGGTALDVFAGAAAATVTDATANATTPDATTKTGQPGRQRQ